MNAWGRIEARGVIGAFPAVFLLVVVLIYPTILTIGVIFTPATWGQVQGAAGFGESLKNTGLWVLIAPLGALIIGGAVGAFWRAYPKLTSMVIAVMLLPMAMSFVAAALAWRFLLGYNGGEVQTGVFNALRVATGGTSVNVLATETLNTWVMIGVFIWMHAGLAAVLVLISRRKLPNALWDIARLEGVSMWDWILRVEAPILRREWLAIWVFLALLALKMFDLVLIFTQGAFGSRTLGFLIYEALFTGQNPQLAAGLSGVLVVLSLLIFVPQRYVR